MRQLALLAAFPKQPGKRQTNKTNTNTTAASYARQPKPNRRDMCGCEPPLSSVSSPFESKTVDANCNTHTKLFPAVFLGLLCAFYSCSLYVAGALDVSCSILAISLFVAKASGFSCPPLEHARTQSSAEKPRWGAKSSFDLLAFVNAA
jgi:hypothetical protein